MSTYIKTGFWKKASRDFKGWLNLDRLIGDVALNTRVRSIDSTSILIPDVELYDMDVITTQIGSLEIANPTGTSSDGNGYIVRVTGDGSVISFGDKFRPFGTALPTSTTPNKTLYIPFVYNTIDSMYDVLPSQEEI